MPIVKDDSEHGGVVLYDEVQLRSDPKYAHLEINNGPTTVPAYTATELGVNGRLAPILQHRFGSVNRPDGHSWPKGVGLDYNGDLNLEEPTLLAVGDYNTAAFTIDPVPQVLTSVNLVI